MDEQAKKFWFTETVIVAGTPFISYFFAFIFEAGRVSVFKMPLEFVNIGLPQVCIFALGLWSVISVLIMFVDSFSILFPSSLTFLRQLLPVIPGSIVVLIYLYKGEYAWSLIYLCLILIFLCPQFIFSFFQLNGKRYIQKTEEWEKQQYELRKNRNSFTIKLMNILGRENIGFIFSLIFIGLLLYETGQFYAVRETRFLIPNNDHNQIVIGMYGDNAICALFNKENRTIQPVYTIYKLSSGITFQSEEIGMVKMEDSKIH